MLLNAVGSHCSFLGKPNQKLTGASACGLCLALDLEKEDDCTMSGMKGQCNLKWGNIKLAILHGVHVGPRKMVLILLLLLVGDTKQIRFTTH